MHRETKVDFRVKDKERRNLRKEIESIGSLSVKNTIRRLCGEKLSSGTNRDVYVLKQNSDWVVKIQKTIYFDNVKEWVLWDVIRFVPSFAKWFAECLIISESGLVLIQRRVEHSMDIKKYPKKVPNYFTDFKIENYGWIDNKFVCCDYSGVVDMLSELMTNKTKSVKWWSVNGVKARRWKKTLLMRQG